MTSNERALPKFVTQAVAQREAAAEQDQPDDAAASAAIAPPEQDRRCFDIACSYLFGDLTLMQAGEQLDALSLGPLRRKNFGAFLSGLDEAKSTDGLTTTSDCWAIMPASATQEGDKLWAAFQADPTVGNSRQLLKGYQAGESALGKRRRRAPSGLSDYATDGDGEGRSSGRQGTAASGSATGIRQAKQPRYVAAPKGAPTTGSDGNETERPIPPGRSKGKGKAVPPKAPSKKTQSSTSKTTNPLLSDKRRALTASEKRVMTKARRGGAARPVGSHTHGPSARTRTAGETASTQSGEVDQQDKGSEGDDEDDDLPEMENRTSTRFFKFVRATKKPKTRRTGEKYVGTDETWQCRLCGGHYTAHPENRSNLALHLNQKVNGSFCSRLFDPIDKSFAGTFQRTNQDAGKDKLASPAMSSFSTPSVRPGRGQQGLDGWMSSQKAQATEAKITEVRRLVLKWVIASNQPFTEPQNPHFREIIRAINPSLSPALTSARTVRRDLEAAHGEILREAVDHLKRNQLTFSVSHDGWTSPSRRYTFLAFVINYVDTDWSFQQFILSFTVLRGPHTGAALAGHLIRALSEHNLLDLWSGILVGDAASANRRMCDALEYEFAKDRDDLQKAVEHRRGDHNIFCFNHVLNRGMVDFYRGMGLKADANDGVLRASADNPEESKESVADDPVDDSDNEPLSDDEGAAETEITSAGNGIGGAEGEKGGAGDDAAVVQAGGVREGELEPDDPEAEEALVMFADVRCKLATVVEEDEEDGGPGEGGNEGNDDAEQGDKGEGTKSGAAVIYSSSDSLREFKKWMSMAYRDHDNPRLVDKVPPKLNQTRWNSRYKQVQAALKIREGLLLYSKNSTRPKVTAIGLTERDFDIAQQIRLVLSYVHRQTLLFERNASNACLVLHRFGELVHILSVEIEEAGSKNGDVAAELKTGLMQMRSKIKRYQEAAAQNKTLLLAGVLHPRYRLDPFEADYPDKVERVKTLLNEEVRALSDSPSGPSEPAVPGSSKHKSVLPKKWRRELPNASSAATIRAEQTEVDAYLANRNPYRLAEKGSKVPGDTVLGWWKSHEALYPTLAKLARRVLSAPGSTSEAERVFSRAGRYVSGRRPLGPTALEQLVGRRPLGPTALEQLVVTSQLLARGFTASLPLLLPLRLPANLSASARHPEEPSSLASNLSGVLHCIDSRRDQKSGYQ
ncbi:unnamed protein product [Tilletia controversa]|nr:unnamed protein product [Tilletia controversa]